MVFGVELVNNRLRGPAANRFFLNWGSGNPRVTEKC